MSWQYIWMRTAGNIDGKMVAGNGGDVIGRITMVAVIACIFCFGGLVAWV